MSSHRYFGEETLRRKWHNPEATLKDIGLRSGMVFMDIGCGDGFFTTPAAQLVGEKGLVYAVDIDVAAVDKLKNKAAEKGLMNIYAKVGPAEATVFCTGCSDIVFYSIVLHDFNDPAKVLRNAREMLKPTGRLIDLDWKKEPMSLGPSLDIRFSEGDAVNLIEAHGFNVDRVQESGAYHYLIIAKLA